MNASALLVLLLFGEPLTPKIGGHLTEGDDRNPAVIPPQRIELTFDHEAHLSWAGLACLDCHAEAERSKKPKDYLVPEKELCIDCHDAVEIPQEWSRKWKRPGNAVAIPPANLHFPHAKHLEIEGVGCLDCHAGVDEAALATREHLPSMETCVSCHVEHGAPTACETCHLSGRGGTIRTAYATGELVPDDHGVHWLKEHEVAAERDMAYCASCHAQTDCLSCHDGALPPVFHDSNYLVIHPQDALANSPPCASCHRLDVFCRDCHFRAGVTTGDRFTSFGDAFHPEGWSSFDVGPDHHQFVARKNLSSCYACHDGENCKQCHVWFGSDAPRTHGPGWAGSSRMRRLRRENLDLCLQCHDLANPSDPINEP